MDEVTVRAMLLQNLEYSRSDPALAHEMYDDDAVLEFPQSGERFEGVENFREWRSIYPASTSFEIREIRGRDDLWVVEVFRQLRRRPARLRSQHSRVRGDKIVRESIYFGEGWEPPEWRATVEGRSIADLRLCRYEASASTARSRSSQIASAT